MDWFSTRRFRRVLLIHLAAVVAVYAGLWLFGVGQRVWEGRSETNQFEGVSFAGDYSLEDSGDLTVAETITLRFPEADVNHGIIRKIPTEHRGRRLATEFVRVTHADGTPVEWTWTKGNSGGDAEARIGSVNAFVHGEQTYRIEWRVRNAVQDYGDLQEFFWDINGDEWFQSFPTVRATVHIPPNLEGKRTGRLRCFDGDNEACPIREAPTPEGGSTITARADAVGPRSTMTISVPFVAGTVDDRGPGTIWRWMLAFFLGVPTLAVAAATVLAATREQRWMRGRPLLSQFVPPPGLTPAEAAEYFSAPDRGIVGQLLLAAVTGQVRLSSTNGRIQATPTGRPRDVPPGGLAQAALAAALGSRGGEKSVDVRAQLAKVKSKDTGYARTRGRFLAGTSSPVRRGPDPMVLGVVTACVAFWLAVVSTRSSIGLLAIVGVQVLWALVASFAQGLHASWVTLRPGKADTFAHLAGLREYIGLADADRLAVLQGADTADRIGPEQEISVYEKLLPWAVVLGVEDSWRERMGADRLADLSWIDGDVAAVTSSGSGLAHSAASVPGTSGSGWTPSGGGRGSGSSSSSSGSSGGGSGGGGGGGGGSGW